jgi:hypothetical protein
MIRINEAKDSPKKTKKLENKWKYLMIWIVLMKINKKYFCSNLFLCQRLKSGSPSSSSRQSWIFCCMVLGSPAALNTV